MMREMIGISIQNNLKFHFVLMDSWFSSMENFNFITGKGKHFIVALEQYELKATTSSWRFTPRSSLNV